MSKMQTKYGLALLLAALTSACQDEPLTLPYADAAREVSAQASVTAGPRDHEAIQQIVNTFDAAWTAGDYVTYAAQYAGAEWVGPNGQVLTNPADITATYQALFTQVLRGTTRNSTIRNLTFLSGTIGVLDIDTRLTGPLPPFIVPWQPGILRALEKNILIKRGSEWQIVRHQQTIVAPGVQ
jgi:ketosteroid isomerase-like protein